LMNENSFTNTNARLRADSSKQTFSNHGLRTYLLRHTDQGGRRTAMAM